MEHWFGGWVGGAAIFGVLAAFWQKIKLLLWRCASLLVVRARVESDLGRALAAYCWKHYKSSPFGEKRFASFCTFVKPLSRYTTVGYEDVGTDPKIFWCGWRPIILTYTQGEGKLGDSMGACIYVGFIRGLFDLDQLLITSLQWQDKSHRVGESSSRYRVIREFGRGAVKWMGESGKGITESADPSDRLVEKEITDRRYLQWQVSELGEDKDARGSFYSLAYPKEVLEVVQRCRRWLQSERWYKDKSIPWRLGCLLTGKPGTGKSSLVRALAQELDLPVYSYDLASFGNRDFERDWLNMLGNTPCIALLEDVDAVFDGRDNRLGEDGGGLTFDCLLNCIGGVKDASGVLVFVTTNRPECLDEALGQYDEEKGVSTRPGRIDLVVELLPLDRECRKKVANRILEDCAWEVEGVVERGDGMTGAQFVEVCAKIALAHYWKEKNLEGERNGLVVHNS